MKHFLTLTLDNETSRISFEKLDPQITGDLHSASGGLMRALPQVKAVFSCYDTITVVYDVYEDSDEYAELTNIISYLALYLKVDCGLPGKPMLRLLTSAKKHIATFEFLKSFIETEMVSAQQRIESAWQQIANQNTRHPMFEGMEDTLQHWRSVDNSITTFQLLYSINKHAEHALLNTLDPQITTHAITKRNSATIECTNV